MVRLYKNAVFLLALLGCSPVSNTDLNAGRVAYENAKIFDGEKFKPGALVIENGKLVDAKPSSAATRIDLNGAWVTPPFCESHNHNIGTDPDPSEQINNYLHDGVFYVRILSNLPAISAAAASFVNQTESVDVAFAHGTVTGPGGHPIQIRRALAKRGRYPGFAVDDLADHAYFEIGDVDDIAEKWPLIMNYQPAVIKVSLVYSDDYEARLNDEQFFGKRGLDPALLPEIVARAHAAGLTVSAHVQTAADFRNAIESGVDDIAHAPGFADRDPISANDARAAAEAGVAVTLTFGIAAFQDDEPEYPALIENQINNASLLKRAGVTMAIGSDNFIDTSKGEVEHLQTLNVFEPDELLRMWTHNCAAVSFPGRKIGRLEPGFEASFLSHEMRPLSAGWSTDNIVLRIKEGQQIELAPATVE